MIALRYFVLPLVLRPNVSQVSNLNRQFLFREENVGQFKSAAAVKRAMLMNPAFQIDARQTLVAPHTENVFDEDFWNHQDLVCNALDNMQARFYVDQRYAQRNISFACVFVPKRFESYVHVSSHWPAAACFLRSRCLSLEPWAPEQMLTQ